jgi:NAD(P)-dependent dehydrogenase (short-subunit alcohol dehydrogenase family)
MEKKTSSMIGETWNMRGKTVVVTGANRGLGRVIARELMRSQARVVMACRSVEHAREVAEEIRLELGFGEFEVRELDLAKPESIRCLARSVTSDYPKLDVLVNNAGVYLKHLQRTPSGLEMTFAINVYGPQLLTGLLVDSLKAAAPSRIIFMASEYAGGLDLYDLQFENRRFNGSSAYRQSKQANRMLTREWARRLKPDRIWVNSMSPNLTPETDLFRQESPAMKRFMRLLGKLFGNPVEEGADTAIWLAADPGLEGRTGGFFRRRRAVKCKFDNPRMEKSLWEHCQALTTKIS